jgi:serine/threonine-protein kinase
MAVEGQTPLIVGRYEVYGELASGGMATVHLGRLTGPSGFARTVAIKRLRDDLASDPEFASRFIDEARLSARIHHPNVVPTLDVVATADQRFYLVMDYVQGEALSRLLRASITRGERIPLRIAIGIMTGALHGLHAAHETLGEHAERLDIVHRDVSPQNIMVGVDGVARVLDFGIAKALGRTQTTRSGQLKGKLCYMAPEQLQGTPVDRRTDVFAASVVLWELLASRPLFASESEAETVGKLLTREIAPPSRYAPDLSAELDAVVMHGLSRTPEGRYPTAQDLALALEELVPAATAAQTGQWVASLAKEALAIRTQRVAEIESRPKRDADGLEPAAERSGSHRAILGPVSPPSSGSLPATDRTGTTPPRRQSIAPRATGAPIADAVALHLATYLGPHTSRVAVKTFSMKAFARGPETLTRADVHGLVQALRPMLRTFVGRAQCELVLEQIELELGA